MTKILTAPLITLVIVSCLFIPMACIKDSCDRMRTYSFYEPVYKTKAEVRDNIKSNAPRSVEQPGKLYIRGNYIFLNEIDKGIHVIDNSNPSNPKNISFIDIPGNIDIAVKGNVLYADLYTDMVALDITNPAQVVVKKVLENLFPYRYYGSFSADNNRVIVDWVKRDTTVTENCDNNGGIVFMADAYFSTASAGGSKSMSPVGKGGSMARFTIMNNRLYTVTTTDLDVFNITDATNPQHANKVNIGWNIETIYPFKNKLFIGSATGMFIYNVSNPDVPVAAGSFSHVRSCDPVIADDDYAYVTLSTGNTCMGQFNQLEILQLNNFTNPSLEKVYTLNNPKGLSKDGDLLFICDGSAGLKIYNAGDVKNLQLLKTIDMPDTYDVITENKIALVVAKDGLYQYNYTDLSNIRLLSKIGIDK